MATGTTPSRTALVVDDEESILSLLDDLLQDAGWTTTCFDRGKPAMDALEHQRFDLMVIDVGLPDMNGLRICLRARERWDDDVMILIITADDQRARSIGAYTAGADEFVAKPFDLGELLGMINARFRPVAS